MGLPLTDTASEKTGQSAPPEFLVTAGEKAARGWNPFHDPRRNIRHLRNRSREAFQRVEQLLNSLASDDPHNLWLVENFRLLRTAERETKDLGHTSHDHPLVEQAELGGAVPRAYAVAHTFLDAAENWFSPGGVEAYLRGIQSLQELEMGEIWALKPMLQLALLERVGAQNGDIPTLINSLREVGEANWKELFESCSVVDEILAKDPVRAYASMDYESRDLYRKAIAGLATRSEHSEHWIAEAALRLAVESFNLHGARSRAAERRAHVGYYLIDAGVPQLRAEAGYKPAWRQHLRDFVLRNPNGFYLLGMEICTFFIVVSVLSPLDTLTPILAGLLLLILPATQAALDFMNNLTSWLIRPRQLPKLDFCKGIPEDCSTLVAVPTLLLSEANIRDLVSQLEIRYLANTSPNLYFALLTDWPDAPAETAEKDDLVGLCVELIEDLNKRYGRGEKTPFYLFHRHRMYNAKEGTWMGWERKRGKLLDLNRVLRGGFDSFPVKVGNRQVFPRLRYVITLDSDTQLPRGSAQRLIGAIAHPLNRAVIHPQTSTVVEGYGILQPRIGISIQSGARSRLANIYSGQTGFDIYTKAVSDVYQDLFGEGIFTGKGIYEVDVLRQTLERRFPDNRLLSHDLIEGAYARAALVSDIDLIDDYPSHFSAYSRRKHRWVRGDWQILHWIFPRVPDAENRYIANPVSLISRWKMLDNARRSLFDPATLLLLLAGWLFLPGGAGHWTTASIVLLLIPVYSSLFFSILRMPVGPTFRAWLIDTSQGFAKGHFHVLLQVVFLLQQALLSLDAILRSLLRTLITKRNLLEWETAAQSEASARKSAVDRYLNWSPWIAIGLAVLIFFANRSALPIAAPILVLWLASRLISAWLNRPRRSQLSTLTAADEQMLRLAALRTWRYFREFSTASNNWLIPDNIREQASAAVERVSPTNLGFLLNANVAAVHLGYLSLPEFALRTRRTLETMLRMPRFYGHYLNWYDNASLRTLDPPFISSVDSGNLVACLWALKQAALDWIDHAPERPVYALGDLARVAAAYEEKYASWIGHADDPARLEEEARAAPQSTSPDANWWRKELLHLLQSPTVPAAKITGDLRWIASAADEIASGMDFGLLYDQRKKLLSIGYNTAEESRHGSCYDLIASESRIASFIAIAKGDVPQEAWFHLGRKHTLVAGRRVLMSWTGTMFEYLMPALWMNHHGDTLLMRSAAGALAVQKRVGKRNHVPWGISESACEAGAETDYGYAAFGIPELAIKHKKDESLVVSPYSSFLALHLDPAGAVRNIRRMDALGWSGSWGFIESVDYGIDGKEPHPIRMWMAHHQGMSLLAVCNLLRRNAFQEHFHAEPQVLATELLLHERVPRSVTVNTREEDLTVAFKPALAAE